MAMRYVVAIALAGATQVGCIANALGLDRGYGPASPRSVAPPSKPATPPWTVRRCEPIPKAPEWNCRAYR